ncbi:MAG TPA: hypothetical protein VF530_22850 [Planctomycetota bacterium]
MAPLLGPSAPPAPRELSRLESRGQGDVTIGSLRFSPDARTLFYQADQRVDEAREVFAAPADGSGEPALSPHGDDFAFSPDGAWVVRYGEAEITSAPLAGGAPIVLAAGPASSVQFTPDSTRLLFWVGGIAHAVPLDGSSPPLPLTPAIGSGLSLTGLVPSPDGTRALYVVSSGATQRLVSVALASGASVELGQLPAGMELIDSFAFTRDSARVVYTAGDYSVFPQGVSFHRRQILGAPSDGSAAPILLNAGAPAASEVLFFPPLLADGGQVLYVSDQDPAAGAALWRVPADGSAAPALLHATPGGSVDRVALDPAGQRAVYVRRATSSDPTHLWVVATDGSGAPLQLSAPGDPGQFVFQIDPLISPDGTRAVYLSYPYPCSVRLDGSAPAELLTPGFQPATRVSGPLHLSADGARVVLVADQDTLGKNELYSVPIDGSQLPVRLSAPLAAEGDVVDVQLAPDGMRVAYLADQEPDAGQQTFEAYSAPIDGSLPAVKVSRLVPGPLTGRVLEFRVQGARAYYRADQEVDEQLELYGVPVDGSGGPVKLNGALPAGGDVKQWALGAQRVAYLADQAVDDKDELFSRPLDGSGTPVRLNTAMTGARDVADFVLVPPGLAAVYRGDQTGTQELFLVPLDASAAPVKLNSTPVAGGRVWSHVASATHVVYRADQDVVFEIELFARPLDRSTPAVPLSPSFVGNSDVLDHALSPDGQRVVFRVRRNGIEELFSAPVDGSAPAVRLHPRLPPGLFVLAYALSPLGDQVVFRADLRGLGTLELFRAPLDGSTPAEPLHPALPAHADVQDFRIDPQGTHVVFRADPFADNVLALFSTPLAGGPVRWLNAAPLAQGHVDFFGHDESGARVLFGARVAGDGRSLFVSPSDGSAPALRLTPSGTSVAGFDALVHGGAAVYRTPAALAWVPVSGGPAQALTAPALSGDELWSEAAAPLVHAPGFVLYLAGREHRALVELFSTPLAPRVERR